MHGYRVSARVGGGVPHRRHPSALDQQEALDAVDLRPVDLVGRPLDVVLAERWEAIRERWSQTTFFLFDPDSWRT